MAQPKSVTTPSMTPKIDEPRMGFSTYAERLNGRAAMMGFIAALVVEYVTHDGALTWLGLISY